MGRSLTSSDDRLYRYVLANQPPEHAELRRLREHTATMPEARLQIAPEQGVFLSFLVGLIGARNVLEIGTFTGYSALAMALALPGGGRLLTCDIRDDWVAIGQPHWARANVADKIEVRLGPAIETLAALRQKQAAGFDFIFIDAKKEDYDGYYEAALTLTRPGGLIVLDNMLQRGAVASPDDCGSRTVAIREINVKIAADARVDRVLLTVGDGMTLVRVR